MQHRKAALKKIQQKYIRYALIKTFSLIQIINIYTITIQKHVYMIKFRKIIVKFN